MMTVDGPRTVGMRARPTDESGWAAPGPSTVRARPTDDVWRDWAANCDPAELDDYCLPMHDILRCGLGTEFDDDWIPMDHGG